MSDVSFNYVYLLNETLHCAIAQDNYHMN